MRHNAYNHLGVSRRILVSRRNRVPATDGRFYARRCAYTCPRGGLCAVARGQRNRCVVVMQ